MERRHIDGGPHTDHTRTMTPRQVPGELTSENRRWKCLVCQVTDTGPRPPMHHGRPMSDLGPAAGGK